jgi:alpha-1,2-mannosyltransferase
VATPVSHMHYYAFVLPLVCGLWLRGLAARPGAVSADRRTTAALAGWGILTAVPLFPGPVFDRLRECGLGPAATIALWAVGLAAVARPRAAVAEPAPPLRRAA